jgi:hypothetical protein
MGEDFGAGIRFAENRLRSLQSYTSDTNSALNRALHCRCHRRCSVSLSAMLLSVGER